MDEFFIQKIWNSQMDKEPEQSGLSLNDIREIREKYGRKITRSSYWSIGFDTLYKSLVVAGYIGLLFAGDLHAAKAVLSSTVTVLFIFFIYKNISLRAQLRSIDETGDVYSVLLSKYDFLARFYKEFLLTSSITHPFFVLAGFQFYLFAKYGEDRLITLLTDPVTYVFLVLSFALPFIVQRTVFARELRDLESILDLELAETGADLHMVHMNRNKKARLILFILFAIAGLAALSLILFSIFK